MNPTQLETPPAFVGHPVLISARKTRARAEAQGSKGHFYRPLQKQFRRDGFRFRQVAREGGAAIYEQTRNDSAEPSVCFELIRVRTREAFEIHGRFIEPAEVYPRSEQWGELGWTFCEKEAAFAKLREIA